MYASWIDLSFAGKKKMKDRLEKREAKVRGKGKACSRRFRLESVNQENLQEGQEEIIGEEFQQECPRGGTCNRGSTGETEQVETWAWVERLIFPSRSVCSYTGCSVSSVRPTDSNYPRVAFEVERLTRNRTWNSRIRSFLFSLITLPRISRTFLFIRKYALAV